MTHHHWVHPSNMMNEVQIPLSHLPPVRDFESQRLEPSRIQGRSIPLDEWRLREAHDVAGPSFLNLPGRAHWIKATLKPSIA